MAGAPPLGAPVFSATGGPVGLGQRSGLRLLRPGLVPGRRPRSPADILGGPRFNDEAAGRPTTTATTTSRPPPSSGGALDHGELLRRLRASTGAWAGTTAPRSACPWRGWARRNCAGPCGAPCMPGAMRCWCRAQGRLGIQPPSRASWIEGPRPHLWSNPFVPAPSRFQQVLPEPLQLPSGALRRRPQPVPEAGPGLGRQQPGRLQGLDAHGRGQARPRPGPGPCPRLVAQPGPGDPAPAGAQPGLLQRREDPARAPARVAMRLAASAASRWAKGSPGAPAGPAGRGGAHGAQGRARAKRMPSGAWASSSSRKASSPAAPSAAGLRRRPCGSPRRRCAGRPGRGPGAGFGLLLHPALQAADGVAAPRPGG